MCFLILGQGRVTEFELRTCFTGTLLLAGFGLAEICVRCCAPEPVTLSLDLVHVLEPAVEPTAHKLQEWDRWNPFPRVWALSRKQGVGGRAGFGPP
jgi:hypothetical protein